MEAPIKSDSSASQSVSPRCRCSEGSAIHDSQRERFCLTGANVDDRDPKVWAVLGKIMLRKRYIIECINHLLKDKGNLVHSRHRSVNNSLMNLIAASGVYCFFDNKPEAIQGYCIEDTNQLSLF